MPGDFYVQPDAPDPVLPERLALALARRHAPTASAVTAVDESGGEARAYAIDSDLILKTQRPQQLRPRTSLDKEVFFLDQLAKHAPDLSVPRALGHGFGEDESGAVVEYTLMTRMPGVAMRHATLGPDARRATLREIGWTLRRIHALPQAAFRESDLFPGDSSTVDLRVRFGRYFGDLADDVRYEGLTWDFDLTPEQVGAQTLASLPWERTLVALHSNPYLEHVFVDADSGAFSGLIDFGDAFISHPACDLRRWTRPEDRAALLEGYTRDGPVSDGFLATWRALGVFTNAMVMAYYAQEQPARATEARALLLQALAEL